MNDLNPNKSSGYDRLDPKILKVRTTELPPSLAVIFNQAIRNREWIPPVHEKDDKQREMNYIDQSGCYLA